MQENVTKANLGDVLFFKDMGFYMLVRFEEKMYNLINLKTGWKKTRSWKGSGGNRNIDIPEYTRQVHLGGNPDNYGPLESFTLTVETEVPVTTYKKVKEKKTFILEKTNTI